MAAKESREGSYRLQEGSGAYTYVRYLEWRGKKAHCGDREEVGESSGGTQAATTPLPQPPATVELTEVEPTVNRDSKGGLFTDSEPVIESVIKTLQDQPPAATTGFGSRIALVIGNSAYRNVSPLDNPDNDAELMTTTLEKAGFKVTKLINADQNTMKRAMLEFGRELRDGADASLFYYSGHGVQVKAENYLIPVDASIKDEDEVGFQAIDVNAFLQTMDSSPSKVKIVVLDACRDNPYGNQFRSASRGLASVTAPSGTYIAYSTAPGSVAEDGDGKNSPYTAALAQFILQPGLKIEEAFKQTRVQVMKSSDQKQVPWESSSLTGDFYFISAQ